jgi:hypothetical protein
MTLLLMFVSFLISLAIGVLLITLLLPDKPGPAGLLFRLFAGGGLGVGVASCLYFICLLTGMERAVAVVDLSACLILSLAVWGLRRRGNGGKDGGGQRSAAPERPECASRSWLDRLIALVFFSGLAASLANFAMTAVKEPHGRWDAWLIWNMHARFLYRSGAQWREAFAGGMDWSHWDYPLLLPLSIARGWTYAGQEELLLPAAMGFLFTFLVLGLLLCALRLLKDKTQGHLAALLLMGTPFFLAMGAAQFADIPLAFFILTAIVMLVFQSRSAENRPGALILAGLAAGLCAWTKNEGLLFLLVATASLLVITARREGWKPSLQRTASFLAGALPVLVIVALFKLRLAPAGDLMAGFGPAALSGKLLDWDRYVQIARAFFLTGMSFTQGLIDIRVGMHLNPGAVNVLLPIAYLLLTGVRIDGRDKTGLLQTSAILLLTTAGYFFVYVLTPLDLTYHLMTSLNRLFLQLWPGFLFAIFMIAGPPGEGATEAVLPSTRSERSGTGTRKGQGKK